MSQQELFQAHLKLNLVFTVAFVIAAAIFSEAYHLASEELLCHGILIGFETISPFTRHTKCLQQTLPDGQLFVNKSLFSCDKAS